MAEMKISSAPLKLTLTDDKGRVVAALRYPRVKWKKLVIESEDAEFDAVVLSGTRVRLEKRPADAEEAAQNDAASDDASTEDAAGDRSDWDPFHEVEFGVRDFLTKAGKAVEDFLDDLSEWSGPISRQGPGSDDEQD